MKTAAEQTQGALAMLVCLGADGRVHNGRVAMSCEDMAGWYPDILVWLRPPRSVERGYGLSRLAGKAGIELGRHIPLETLDFVAAFHRVFGQCVHDSPYLTDDALNEFRLSILQEELNELREALTRRDPVAALDALTDLQYVLDGTYLSLGLHRWKNAAFAEVHRSNMTKLGADGRPLVREDGKILKGPNYTPPDLAAVLSEGAQ